MVKRDTEGRHYAAPLPEQTWRTARADALEATADAVSDCLAHVENVIEAHADDDDLTASLRETAGRLRTKRNDHMGAARALRAQGGEPA